MNRPKATKPKQCVIAPRDPTTGLPVRCAARVLKAGRCAEHYREWRKAREARRLAAREHRAGAPRTKRKRVAPPSTAWVNPRKPYQPPEMRFAYRDVSPIDQARLDRAAAKRLRKAQRRRGYTPSMSRAA